jgi:histidinol-phosphatase (PHP family)
MISKLADYHTHTPLCRHADGSAEQFIDAALAAGLGEIGFADHAPLVPEPFDDWRMLVDELPQYFDWIAAAKARAAGRIPVRAGLECDWLDDCRPWIEDLASRYPWDYLIGSVHYLDGWDFDNPVWLGRWASCDVEDAWRRYWKTYATMASSGCFDILAHPDLIKKFGYVPAGDLSRYYDPVIQALSDSGCAIEINTAGWHKPCAEAYPSAAFLKLAASARIPLLISSDAHAPHEVARDFPRAFQLALECGFSETVRFEHRRRSPTPLV